MPYYLMTDEHMRDRLAQGEARTLDSVPTDTVHYDGARWTRSGDVWVRDDEAPRERGGQYPGQHPEHSQYPQYPQPRVRPRLIMTEDALAAPAPGTGPAEPLGEPAAGRRRRGERAGRRRGERGGRRRAGRRRTAARAAANPERRSRRGRRLVAGAACTALVAGGAFAAATDQERTLRVALRQVSIPDLSRQASAEAQGPASNRERPALARVPDESYAATYDSASIPAPEPPLRSEPVAKSLPAASQAPTTAAGGHPASGPPGGRKAKLNRGRSARPGEGGASPSPTPPAKPPLTPQAGLAALEADIAAAAKAKKLTLSGQAGLLRETRAIRDILGDKPVKPVLDRILAMRKQIDDLGKRLQIAPSAAGTLKADLDRLQNALVPPDPSASVQAEESDAAAPR
jgi:hypothetical protein